MRSKWVISDKGWREMQPCAVYRRLGSAVKSHIGCKGKNGRRHSMQMVTKREQGWPYVYYKIDFNKILPLKTKKGIIYLI